MKLLLSYMPDVEITEQNVGVLTALDAKGMTALDYAIINDDQDV